VEHQVRAAAERHALPGISEEDSEILAEGVSEDGDKNGMEI
jgi:hypothetical protein